MPAVALGDALRKAGHETILVTEGRAVERSLLARAGGEARSLQVSGGRFAVPWSVLRAALQARGLLRRERIDLVLSTGGRTSVPVALAAKSLGLPVCLLEQNATTGRANKMLRPMARRVYHGLPSRDVGRARGVYSGTPLRSEVGRVDREAARRELGLALDEPVVLVTGGSQGAASLNRVLPAAVGAFDAPLQVVHLAGEGNDESVRRAYATTAPDRRVLVRAIAGDMADLYAAADLVVCRGGGSTVAELMAAGRASIIVPYPHHRDRQQWHNGSVLASAGAALLCNEAELEPVALAAMLQSLFGDPNRLLAMARAAAALAKEDPCAWILADLRSQAVLD